MLSIRWGCAALLLGMLAFESACVRQPTYFAEYALAEEASAESVACYDGCTRSSRAEFREACFAHCEGIVATTTSTPCRELGRKRCTWQELAEPEEPSEEQPESDGEGVAGAVIGTLLNALVTAGEHSRSEPSESAESARKSPERREVRVPARPRRVPSRHRE